MLKNDVILKNTKDWIQNFIIAFNLCPFASLSFDADTIDYKVVADSKFHDSMSALVDMITRLKSSSPKQISNMFLIFNAEVDFQYLLDLEASLDYAMEEANADRFFQTVVFHPEFRFDGEAHDSHGNFINRSPHPMIHILRTDEVSQAIEGHANIDEVPDRNKQILEHMYIDKIHVDPSPALRISYDSFEGSR